MLFAKSIAIFIYSVMYGLFLFFWSIAKSIKYTVDLVGADYVALGSDYDGAIKAPFDVTGLNILVEAMLNIGLTPDQIRKVMAENVKNFWLKNL